MQRGNQRLPMLSIQNKNENSSLNRMKNKNQEHSKKTLNLFILCLVMIVDDNKTQFGNIKPLKEDKNFSYNEVSEKQLADGEYLKNVQKALQTAINENEEVIIIFALKFLLQRKKCGKNNSLSYFYYFI